MICAFLSCDSGEFREFDVITNLNGDDATVGVKHFDAISRADTPPLAFAGGDVNLVLFADRTIATKQIGDVVQRVVLDHELRAADDVNVILDGHFGKEVKILRGEFCQASGSRPTTRGFHARQQLRREQLGEQHEVAFIVRGCVEKELALLCKFFETADGPHLILDDAYANGFNHIMKSPFGPANIFQVGPF